MSLRNVTLTAVAALSLGMAANAQSTTTVTVPLNEPGTQAPAATGPGTTVTVQPDGTTTVETTAAPTEAVSAEEAEPQATDTTPPVAEEPAVEEPAQELAADEPVADEPEAVEPTAEEPAADAAAEPAEDEATADAEAEAPAEEAGAEEPPQEEAPVEEATAEEPAEAEVPAEEAGAEEAAAEATADEQAAEEPAAEEGVVQDATAEEPAAEEPAEDVAPQADEAAAAAKVVTPVQVIRDTSFSFEGPFGKYDQMQLQRGLQVYTEVCAGCHGLTYVPLRTLSDANGPGLPEDQMRAYAAEMFIYDPELDDERPREPTDHFPTVSGEGMGPDLSLMAKARAGFHGPYGTGINQLIKGIGGPEYIYSILTGYTGEESEQAGSILYENTAFAGGLISMAAPLFDDHVEYADGSPTDVESMARDVAAFLMWTAEPKMMERKQAGLVSVLFLILLTVLLYLSNKRLWWPIKHRNEGAGDKR